MHARQKGSKTMNVRQAFGYGIFGLLAVGATAACIADIGWQSLIVLGVVAAIVLATRLIEG